MSEAIDGLAERQAPGDRCRGRTDPVTPVQLITKVRAIQGWAAGTPADSEDTLRFAELSGVRPMVETYPLERAAEAYAHDERQGTVPRGADDVRTHGGAV